MKATLEELLALRTVVDTGSITAAAAQLGQTTSGISRALRRLEDKLGTTLLNRTTRRLMLTAEGELFLARAREVLAALDAAEDELAARRGEPAGRLRVNAAMPFMLHVLAPLAAAFAAAHPRIALELHTDDLPIDLLQEDTDLAIRIGPLADSTLRARRLAASRLRVLASPAYLAAHGEPRDPAALCGSGHVRLGFTRPQSLNRWPLSGQVGHDGEGTERGDEDGFVIVPTIAASSGETLRRLALDGAGIVCLSDFLTAADCAAGALVPVMTAHTREVWQPIHAVFYRHGGASPRVAAFIEFLAERLAAQPWAAGDPGVS